MSMLSTNKCEECPPRLEKVNEQVLKNHSKSLKIHTLVHPCTFSTLPLHTWCKGLVQLKQFHLNTTEGVHMGGLTTFQRNG